MDWIYAKKAPRKKGTRKPKQAPTNRIDLGQLKPGTGVRCLPFSASFLAIWIGLQVFWFPIPSTEPSCVTCRKFENPVP